MTPHDYKKVKEIFQSVLDAPPEQRIAELDDRCSDDPSLRREVERLLDSYESEYLESPAVVTVGAEGKDDGLAAGSEIGHYTIVEKIGSGGMGEVYLAEDGKLGRRVAIKILPEAFTKDEDRLRRFNQEARTASALNHPNILTIHEIGEANGANYIATEFIDGETLRQKLNRERLSVAESLDIAIQTASALAAAHEAGIIHRDIKPENIMLRRDNLVKVLDFGLAKLAEPKDISVSHDAKTEKHVKTAPGVIMGTIQYMSPEQTRGHATDARTDIWSLGVVLYEMLAGTPPFKGENSADLIADIVRSYPTPLSQTADDIPERLDEIAAKALEKDPNERYQTAKDLLIDLKRLKRKLDLEHEAERSHASATTSGRTSVDSSGVARTAEVAHETAEPEGRSKNTVSSAEYIVSGIQKHKRAAALIAIALLVAAAGLGTAAWYGGLFAIPESQPRLFDSYTMTPFTTSGKSQMPAISRDGRLVAFAVYDGRDHSLIVRQIATGSEVVLLPPRKLGSFTGVRFSPDGNYIYFTIHEPGDPIGRLYRTPTLGGIPKKLIDDVDSNVSFSPDGGSLVFVRHSQKANTSSIMIANSDGTDPRPLIATEGAGSSNDVAWSPVSDILIVSRSDPWGAGSGGTSTLATFSTSTGELKPLGEKAWLLPMGFSWLNDGSGIVFVAGDEGTATGKQDIWMVTYPDGTPRQLTNDPDRYPAISAIADDTTIAVERETIAGGIWSLDLNGYEVDQIRSDNPDLVGMMGFQELPDGRFLAARGEAKSVNFWIFSADWKGETRLTNEPSMNRHHLLTPDGKHVVFLSDRTGKWRIWRMDIDSANAIQLTDSATGGQDTEIAILPDGKTILFAREGTGQVDLLKTTIDGGEPVVVFPNEQTTHRALSVSRDGKYLAHWVSSTEGTVLRISEIRGDQIFPTPKEISVSEIGHPTTACPWIDHKTIVCGSVKDRSNLFMVSLDDGSVKKITNFQDRIVVFPALSRDGSRLLFSRFMSNTDIYLMKDTSIR